MSFALDTAEQITQRLDELIARICPKANRRSMYGGTVFQKDPKEPSSMVCGHFIYKAHVGMEFSQGYRLKDSGRLLEGGGKFRRHVKLQTVDEIDSKNVREFLKQAFALDPP